MSVHIRWDHPFQFLKLAHIKVVHFCTCKKLVHEKPYDTTLKFQNLLGPQAFSLEVRDHL